MRRLIESTRYLHSIKGYSRGPYSPSYSQLPDGSSPLYYSNDILDVVVQGNFDYDSDGTPYEVTEVRFNVYNDGSYYEYDNSYNDQDKAIQIADDLIDEFKTLPTSSVQKLLLQKGFKVDKL